MISEVQTQCKKCKSWFKSGFQSDEFSFASLTIKNSSEKCTVCGKETGVSSNENMRFAKKD
jgi:hypothetical protein